MKGNIAAILLYLVVTVAVMYSWFHYGLMYGGGDVGLPTYNSQRVLQMISQPWWTETAPGFPRPQNLTALPAYVFFAFLQNLGLPAFMTQAVIFGILLFLMGFGMYLMAKDIMKSENRGMAILAGFFYMVNPYMMVLVWHRFTHTTFFFAASLPLLLLFWRKWIKEKEFTSLIIFIAVNLIFSYMFGTLAYVITLWFLLGMYILFEIFIPWIGLKKASQISASFSLGLILWVLTNTWWIIPLFFVLPSLASTQHSVGNTVSTLFAIGVQSIIPYSLAGLNSFYLFQGQELGEAFKHPLFLFIPYLGVFFIMMGIYYTIKKRELIFWSILFIIAVFLAKGVAPPLGYFYAYLFEKFFFLGLLRNPFEKFGLLIPLAGSILFSVGFFNLAAYFWKRNFLAGKAAIILSFCLFFGIYHWPFWTGTFFGTLEKRNFVEIPQYYQEANLWIKDQNKDGNILHLPLAIAESSTYRWQYGYSGAESNVVFFTSNPSISMGFNLSYLDDALQGFDLMAGFDQMKHREYLKELFRAFNVRFIVLHNDINWQNSALRSPEQIAKLLDSLSFLKKQKEIGELTIYEVADDYYLNKIYLASGFDYLQSTQSYDQWSWFLRNDPSLPFIFESREKMDFVNLPKLGVIIIMPSVGIKVSFPKLASEENAVKELPAVRFLPDSPLYQLIILKELIQNFGFERPHENINLTFAGKRLVEAYKMQEKASNKSISTIIQKYIWNLDKAVAKLFKDGDLIKAPDWLKELLARHEAVLARVYVQAKKEDRNVTREALQFLRKKIIEMNLSPIYDFQIVQDLDRNNRQVYRFTVSLDGQYEILMMGASIATIYQNGLKQLNLQIDGNIQSRNAQIKDDLISYGTIFLKSGVHEISFNTNNSINLFKDKQHDLLKEVEITSGNHSPNAYEIKIEPLYPNSTYLISFDYWTKKGNEPIVKTVEDSDPQYPSLTDVLSQQRSSQFIDSVKYDPYIKDWKNYTKYISPRNNSSKLSFQVLATPWDNCQIILAERWLCNKPEIKYIFEKPSTIVIRNIKIYRVLDNTLFLRSQEKNQVLEPPSNMTYVKKAPLVYEGSITIDKPQFMIFSETFNDGWELTLYKDGEEYKPAKHFFANIYGNGWLLDKNGTYKFRIIFSPQKYLYLGIYISIFSLLIFTGVYLVIKYLKWSHEKNN